MIDGWRTVASPFSPRFTIVLLNEMKMNQRRSCHMLKGLTCLWECWGGCIQWKRPKRCKSSRQAAQVHGRGGGRQCRRRRGQCWGCRGGRSGWWSGLHELAPHPWAYPGFCEFKDFSFKLLFHRPCCHWCTWWWLVWTELLNRGDFFTARRIWDKSERKFHDHFAFVKER